MANSLYHVPCSSLTFGSNKGCSFTDAAEGFSEVASTADKRCFELVFVDVEQIVGRRKDLTFIDAINFDFLYVWVKSESSVE